MVCGRSLHGPTLTSPLSCKYMLISQSRPLGPRRGAHDNLSLIWESLLLSVCPNCYILFLGRSQCRISPSPIKRFELLNHILVCLYQAGHAPPYPSFCRLFPSFPTSCDRTSEHWDQSLIYFARKSAMALKSPSKRPQIGPAYQEAWWCSLPYLIFPNLASCE